MGEFGKFCVEAYGARSDLQVVAVADLRANMATQVAGKIGARPYVGWHDLLADDDVEIVHISTPPNTHSQIGVAAAQLGKSIFYEKPLAITLAEADAAINAADRGGVVIGVDYVMRHHPIYQLLIRIHGEGLLGHLRRVSLDNAAQTVPADHWFWDRSLSGGILVEHGVHFFDVVSRLAGPGQPRRTVDRPPRVLSEVEYAGGAWGSFYHDFSLDPRIERTHLTAVFEIGTALVAGWIPETLHVDALVRRNSREWESLSAFDGVGVAFDDDGDVVHLTMILPDRRGQYLRAIVAGMRDIARAHRDPLFAPEVSVQDARSSLALALEAQAISE